MAPGAGRRLARHLGTQPSFPVAQPMGSSTNEDVVHKYVGHRLKDFRCKLHKHYLKQGDDIRVRRAKPYDGVTQENWEMICNWFEDPEFKHKSEVNIANRKAQLGLGRIGLYRETHFSNKRDRWIAPLAEENHDAMVTLQNQASANAEDTPPNEDEIIIAVLGEKRGYIRGLGHGVMPPSSSSSRHNAVVEELQRNIEEANRRLEQAEIRNTEAERHNEELQRQVQALQSWQAQMEDAFMSGIGSGASSWVQCYFGSTSPGAQT